MCPIEISLAANGSYFCGLLITAYSMTKHTRAPLRFNILDGGIADADWAFFQSAILRINPNCSFNRIRITGEEFKDCLLWHGNHMTYARLLLPELLPEVDYCVYCDVDFLWMRDIAELWNERREDIALISTWDGTQSTWDVDGGWLKANGFEFSPDDYFCAGLTFFNLKYFREYGLQKRCFELLQLKPPFNDQTVMYIATNGHTKLVSEIWQRFPERVTQAEIDGGCVVHHAGELPWRRVSGALTILSDTILLWHRLNAEINGITVWQSLRRYNGVFGILYHRALWWLFRCPIVMLPLKFACSITHHSGVYGFITGRARKLRMK